MQRAAIDEAVPETLSVTKKRMKMMERTPSVVSSGTSGVVVAVVDVGARVVVVVDDILLLIIMEYFLSFWRYIYI